MRYRHAYIENDKVLANSGTEVIDIRVKDPITELMIRIFATNCNVSNIQCPMARCITKIELVDGSDVLFSMSGQQAIALAYYDSGRMPARKIVEWNGFSQVDHIPIRFGRFMGDPLLAFDPTKFTNPQLKITWDLEAINAIDTFGFASGTGRLTVIAKVMEDAGGAVTGFLMNKEHYSWTTAASGDENIDLPTDYPCRKLLVRSYIPGSQISDVITNLKVTVDQGKFIPFDLNGMDLARMHEDWFGVARQEIHFKGDNGDVREVWIDMEVGAWGLLHTDVPGIVSIGLSWAARCTLGLIDHAGNAMSDAYGYVYVTGRCPESTFCYPFGRQDVIEEAFNAPEYGSVRLVLTQGTINAAASVMLQQIRSY